jgi:hypothetical protein
MSSRRFFTLVITLVWIGIAVTRAMAQEITVTQAVVCQEIVDRMPVGAGDVIPAGTDRVFCFTQIDGIHEAAEITHNWYYQGSLKRRWCFRYTPRLANLEFETLLPEWTGEWWCRGPLRSFEALPVVSSRYCRWAHALLFSMAHVASIGLGRRLGKKYRIR